MRNKFDMQLDNMNKMLVEMGELCEKAIANATKAVADGNLEMAKIVIGEDEEIDQMEKDIERLCLKLLLQQQPVAKDLRQISAALKMITDMERIGDQASDIAEILLSARESKASTLPYLTDMATATSKMVTKSVQAFVEKDLELTRKVIASDDKVDTLFDQVKERLISFLATTENQGERAIDMLMIAKYLERIGDHATNIAEWVEFSITGVHREQREH
ncbi:phosphate signaling complex protein PhoU [Faecalimonas sp.]